MDDPDLPVRLAAFEFLERLAATHGEALPRSSLERGFAFHGMRIPLVGPQGIFKPAAMRAMPLSITTTPVAENKPRRYEDHVTPDGLIVYRYRGRDPMHHENVGLRRAMENGAPLVYFFGLVPGWYAASWPVYVVSDDRSELAFTVAVDDAHHLGQGPSEHVSEEYRRRYITRLQVHRLHQASFRQRVIRAYRQACAICRLKHAELLDAAHILPDTHTEGEPRVRNGLALCKLHHAAFDRNIVGVRPDLEVEINRRVLEEIDGPMLVHGLQGFHGVKLHVPTLRSQRPNPEALAHRYEAFRQAG